MNHIKKAEIVFPEVSDRKLHVQRKITVETAKNDRTKFQDFCETLGFAIVFTVGLLAMIGFLVAITE